MKNIALCLGIAALLTGCARQDDMGGTDTTQTDTGRSTTTATNKSPQITTPSTESGQATGVNQDQRITDAVKNAISLPGTTTGTQQVRVNVSNGVVTLQGTVRSMEEKQQIETKAKAVSGVTRVDNQLQVSEGQGRPQQGQSESQSQQGQPQQGQTQPTQPQQGQPATPRPQ